MTPTRRAPQVARLRLAGFAFECPARAPHARVDAIALALEMTRQHDEPGGVLADARQPRLEPAPEHVGHRDLEALRARDRVETSRDEAGRKPVRTPLTT